MSDYFKIEGLTFAYQGYGQDEEPPAVFRNLSLTLQEGGKVLILGPPDSGKTTLARIMSGLLPRYIEGELKGEVLLNGRSVPNLAPLGWRKGCRGAFGWARQGAKRRLNRH
jgi:ABC-type multidrug transport system ATPase subunit